jgi:hypothetical protein
LSELIKYRLNNENESTISNKKIMIFIIIIEKNKTSIGLLKSNDQGKKLKFEGSKGEFATTLFSNSDEEISGEDVLLVPDPPWPCCPLRSRGRAGAPLPKGVAGKGSS